MLVSVIIPTYNRSKTIARAVNSVLAQTWKEIEVIVVDDGSTDQTKDVLSQYGDKIRVIRQQNGGPSAARNTGINASKGDIISFLDSDDEWLPSKTERQVRLFQGPQSVKVVGCVCNARMLYSTGAKTSFQIAGLHPKHAEGVWANPAQILVDRFLLFNQVASIRRAAFEKVGCFRQDMRLMEDYDMALRLSLAGPWAYVADPLVIWHEDAGSGLSRNVSQHEISRVALTILDDLSHSAHLRGRLQGGRLRHRRWLLKSKMDALVLASQSDGIRAFSGKLILVGLRIYEALYRRSPFIARMKTNQIEGQSADPSLKPTCL
jgi:glycosyltransferase involved in cell wall biosynthesis